MVIQNQDVNFSGGIHKLFRELGIMGVLILGTRLNVVLGTGYCLLET